MIEIYILNFQCYDLRFSELSTILRKNGATILTYPSAFAYSTGKAHWETLLRSRAIENQCYVIAAAQNGFHNTKRQSYGHAMVVDPWGKILIECPDEPKDRIQCLTIEIDTNLIDDIRERMPCYQHRRNDIYTLVPLKLISPKKSIGCIEPMPKCQHDDVPYFLFEKYPIQKSTIFHESSHCLAFTNIRCVVTGRKFCRVDNFSAMFFQLFNHYFASFSRYFGCNATLCATIEGFDARRNS